MPNLAQIENQFFQSALGHINKHELERALRLLSVLYLKNPKDIRTKINLCICLVNMQRFDDVMELLDDKELEKYGAKYHFLQVVAQIYMKNIDKAAFYLRKIIKTPECSAQVIINFSIICFEQKQYKIGKLWVYIGLKYFPNEPILYNQYIHALEQLYISKPQIRYYQKLLTINPSAEMFASLSYIFFKELDYQASADTADKGLALEPNHPRCLSSKATALRWLGRPYEAYDIYQTLIKNGDLYDSAKSNYALLLETLDKCDLALNILAEQLQETPEDATLHFFRAQINLRLGNFVEGFHDYQYRWSRMNHVKTYGSKRPGPFWRGEDLTDKILYVHHEQGYGDTIMFARFIPYIKEITKARAVFIDTQPKLIKLMRQLPNIDFVFHPKEPQPVTDYTVSILSIPTLMPIVKNQWLPDSSGYIKPLFKAELNLKNTQKLKVGIVWRGNPEQPVEVFRHCPIKELEPLINRNDIQLFNFQPEACSRELKELGIKKILDLTPHLEEDFTNTAALINEMDLMITTCTALANLSGAMGKRTLVMVPWMADWRWGTYQMKKSWWYDSVEIFRQRALFQWREVIQDVMLELDKAVAQKHAGL